MQKWNIYFVNPTAHHDSWGVAISRRILPVITGGEDDPCQTTWRVPPTHYEHLGTVEDDCDTLVRLIMRFSKTAFHQGGHHEHDERCGDWHYIEFFGPGPDVEFGLGILQQAQALTLGLVLC